MSYAALNYYKEKSIIFAKIFRLPVCSVCQYLLLCQRVVQSPQCSLWSIILDNLLGDCKSARGSRLLPSNCSFTDPPRKSPRGRRSRPFQRGATECQAWNQRIYLAGVLWFRLRRAERICAPWALASEISRTANDKTINHLFPSLFQCVRYRMASAGPGSITSMPWWSVVESSSILLEPRFKVRGFTGKRL